MAEKIKAVIFDMDGVLVDSEEFICEAACSMFKELGLDVKPEDFEDFVGTGEDRYIGGVAEKYNFQIDLPQAKKRTYQIYLDIIKGKLKPLAGVKDFISRCGVSGLKLAVASSADSIKVRGNLDEIGLPFETFGAVITGSDIERKKPAPDIFLLAAEKLGVEPSRALVIEDAPSGVEAAKAAGCRCLAITSSFTREQLSKADFHAADLADVPEEVYSLF
ncbi:Phosphorylated carbohydrates phosphatase [Limihaloglobus sulfuriphilus]|uniref:Phosphorylated carbohydrates phosphatase n=1 Tax=Limihaloglobus sulfuriphilus TaxID=1851148 RepID=A0A1Q2MC63_9BACT|nr:HAD-IA family hydrolase [Limihaloglobus sulfuriphilus]AQQ70249.1 Phosphorylated carbohydrates phosphatase [Limihaloglobus sulfuriphilus]